jgi:hypothetical protein
VSIKKRDSKPFAGGITETLFFWAGTVFDTGNRSFAVYDFRLANLPKKNNIVLPLSSNKRYVRAPSGSG